MEDFVYILAILPTFYNSNYAHVVGVDEIPPEAAGELVFNGLPEIFRKSNSWRLSIWIVR